MTVQQETIFCFFVLCSGNCSVLPFVCFVLESRQQDMQDIAPPVPCPPTFASCHNLEKQMIELSAAVVGTKYFRVAPQPLGTCQQSISPPRKTALLVESALGGGKTGRGEVSTGAGHEGYIPTCNVLAC